MSSTYRTQSVNTVSEEHKTQERNSTQLLEKILLSSSSNSSQQQRKIQTQSTHHQHNLTNHQMILQSTDNNSTNSNGPANAGSYTYRGVAFNNTGKNWRKLITPAHDSFKKFQQQQPEYSGQYLGGSHVTNQHDRQNGATTNSNDTSIDTSGHYSSVSVKEFNPSQYELKLQPLDRDGTDSKSIEIQDISSEESKGPRKDQHHQSSLRTNYLISVNDDNSKQRSINAAGGENEFGTSSLQMKSLMKSFSNGNFQFYENLHKKYFEMAKDKSQKSSKPPTASQMSLDKSTDKDLFTLTSKTGTMLGISQLKQSVDTLKANSRTSKANELRASSLKANKSHNTDNRGQNTMSINFKNSLFKKMNANSIFFDDNSQSQIHLNSKDQNTFNGMLKRRDYFDTSSSSESSDFNLDDDKSDVGIKQRRELEELGKQVKQKRDRSHNVNNRNRNKGRMKDNFEEELLGDKYQSVLSRRDLSVNQEDTLSQIDSQTPRDFLNDIKHLQRINKFEREKQLALSSHNGIPKSRGNTRERNSRERGHFDQFIRESQGSPSGLYHGLKSLISSENHQEDQKTSMNQSSLQFSHSQHPELMRRERNYYDNNDTTDIIFEQPTREEAMGDTYNQGGHILRGEVVLNRELKAEDLSTDNDFNCQSSQISSSNSNDVLKTFQEFCLKARTRQIQGDGIQPPQIYTQQYPQTNHKQNPLINSTNSHSNLGGHQSSTPALFNNMNSDKQSIPRSIKQINRGGFQMQSAAPANRQQQQLGVSGSRGGATILTTNTKKGNSNYLQASGAHQNNENMLAMNQDQKSDFTFVLSNPTDFNYECNCNNQTDSFLTQKHARLLQNGDLLKQSSKHILKNRLPEIAASPIFSENGNLPPQQHHCQHCGGNKVDVEDQSIKGNNRIIGGNQRASYTHLNHQSIQEEDEDEEYYHQQNADAQKKQVFEYVEANHEENEREMVDLQQYHALIEDMKFHRVLLNVAYEYMAKMLHEGSLPQGIKAELSHVLSVIQSAINSPYSNSNQEQPRKSSDEQAFNECDGNMTMSELRLNNQHFNVREEKKDETNQSERQVESSKLSELVVMEDQNNPTGEQKLRKRQDARRMKSSLISQSQQSSQQAEDTVYSYYEDEQDEDYDDINREPMENRERNTLRDSHYRGGDIRKSLRKSMNTLSRTKQQLKKEKFINRQQEDQLKKMQAEIEALNQRWQMTEERIRSGENMYHMLSRTTNQYAGTNTHLISANNIRYAATPPPFNMGATNPTSTVGHYNSQSNFLMNRDTITSNLSPIQISQTTSNHQQSHNILTATNDSKINPPSSQGDTSQNNKTLIDINDRLTRQIEDNLQLFENLNLELTVKDTALLHGEAKLSEKERELKKLKDQLMNMNDNMKKLAEVTKSTSEATESSKIRHLQEMEKIKKRQEDYQQKLNRIQNVFEKGNHISSFTSDEAMTQTAYQLKYGATRNAHVIGKSNTKDEKNDDFSNHTSHIIQDEELSIGQIQNLSNGKDTSADMIPIRLQKTFSSISKDKENMHPNIPLNLSAQNSFKFEREQKQGGPLRQKEQTPDNSLSNIQAYSGIEDDSSALLKYSQDVTNSQLLTTMRLSRQRQNLTQN